MSHFFVGFHTGKKVGSNTARLAIRRKLYKELRRAGAAFDEHFADSGQCLSSCPEGNTLRTKIATLETAIKITGGRP